MLPDWRAPESLKTRPFSRRRRPGRALRRKLLHPCGASEPPAAEIAGTAEAVAAAEAAETVAVPETAELLKLLLKPLRLLKLLKLLKL